MYICLLEEHLTMKILFCLLLVFWGTASAQSQSNSTATGISTAFNPAISVNGLFLGYYQSAPLMREPAFGHDHEDEAVAEMEATHAEEHGLSLIHI